MTDLVGDFRTSITHHSLNLSDSYNIQIWSNRTYPFILTWTVRLEVIDMAFSYANTSKSASQHMDEVMTRLKAKEAYLKNLRKQLFQKRSVSA